MGKRTIFLSLILVLMLGLLSYNATFALFSDSTTSTNNIFAAASVFPSPSGEQTPPPSGSPSPSPNLCLGTIFANGVSGNVVGTKKDNSAITDPNRINPNNATGANDWVVGTGTGFYSIGKNGQITLTFSSPLVDLPGDNLTFYEATNGRDTYPLEKVDVSVSSDGTNFNNIGSVTSESGVGGTDGITTLNLAGNTNITHVRLIESTDFNLHTDDSDGFDLDAVSGTCGIIGQ